MLFALQIQLLHLCGDTFPTHAGKHLEVKVRTLGTHATGVQRHERPNHVGALFGVFTRHNEQRRHDFERLALFRVARFGKALIEAAAIMRVVFG